MPIRYEKTRMPRIKKAVIIFVISAVLFVLCVYALTQACIEGYTYSDNVVFVTASGECYHTAECRYVKSKQTIATAFTRAKSNYRACSACDPDIAELETETFCDVTIQRATVYAVILCVFCVVLFVLLFWRYLYELFDGIKADIAAIKAKP